MSAEWVRTESDKVAVRSGCYFDMGAAERVKMFFEKFLRHSKGQFAGKPFVLLEWQWRDVIAPLFGWKRPDGTRRFRRCGIAVPKKNGKSTLLAGIGLYLLVADREPGAEVYTAAADRDQASIIYNEAASMVQRSTALTKLLRPLATGRKILYPRSSGVLKALSADVPTKEGLNIHGLLFDELHAQRTRDLWNALRYGGAARQQPLLFWISTAGINRESLCYEQWEYARGILNGTIIDPDYLAVIYEANDGDDWRDEATWKKANPSLGITISADSFAADAREAEQSEAAQATFKRYRLNLWTNQEVKWIAADSWKACRSDFKASDLDGKRCFCGLDLSAVSDITALSLLFPIDRKYRLLNYYWLPEGAMRRRQMQNKVRFDSWVRQKRIELTRGDAVDYSVIRKRLGELRKRFHFNTVAVDPWNSLHLCNDLAADGFTMEWIRTGFASLSAPSKEFERWILNKEIEHNGDPVLAWMVDNVVAEIDASANIKPSKKKSAEKIDGVVSAITAVASFLNEKQRKPSKYEAEQLRGF